MQLTRFTDLSLRVLMYLARSDPQRTPVVTIAEIASQFEVPHNHLIKVVNKLGKLGWIAAQRGRNGGLRIGIEPAQLRLGQALRELENRTDLVDCASINCRLDGQCLLRHALDVGQQAMFSALDQYTLADVVQNPTGNAIVSMHRLYLAQTADKPGEVK